MRFIEEYRDKDLIRKLSAHIHSSAKGNYLFMEVCGGHTAAIHRFGIPSILPSNIRLISGPGCPVCVTGTGFIDNIIVYSGMKDVIIATFGDLMRVPGSYSSLEKERPAGADIRVVFSPLEALNIARANPSKTVIFPSIGFETTAPGSAVTVIQAEKEKVKNFLVLNGHKTMPAVMETVVSEIHVIDGFLCPGHVAAITGSRIFEFLPRKYNTGCVVSGFEPADILQAVLMLVNQVNNRRPGVETAYKRAVSYEGNRIAMQNLTTVFEPCDALWRGFGIIKGSGLKLRKEFEDHDASKVIPVNVDQMNDNPLCICGDILRGKMIPLECPLFRSQCTPENPVGACMVSPEGTCNTFYKYSGHE